ncbi:MAG: esterase/lipase family protein [Planctomycetota bacterium]
MHFGKTWMVVAAAALVVLTVEAARSCGPLRVEQSRDRESGMEHYLPLRQAVLGYVIEQHRESDRCRVRAVLPLAPQVICTGGRDECERALVEVLETQYGDGHPNLPFQTLGAKQFWTDLFWYNGWRIQQHCGTGHCRLLDPDDLRRAWGTREACRVVFERLRHEQKVARPQRHLVVLLHGLGRAKSSLTKLGDVLTDAGYGVASVSYASTRDGLDGHVERLEQLLNDLDDVEQVSFVTHSLGGVVARGVLNRPSAWRDRIELGKLVMLAPPNRTVRLAELAQEIRAAGVIMGDCVHELAEGAAEKLAVPPLPFGIIAGAKGDGRGWNPLIEGDDDGVVGVEETRLLGAADFLALPVLHSFIMNAPAVHRATLSFLATSSFSP